LRIILLEIARHAETIIGVLKFGGDAGAGGAAGDFDVVAPGASAGGFALADIRARFGAAGIAVGRGGVVVGIVPVAAPFVDVVAEVVKAEGIGGVAGDGLGSGLPASGVVGKRFQRFVAPGKIFLFEIAAGGALPFGLSGEMVGATGLGGQPLTVMVGFEPGDAGYGLLGMVEIFVVPEWRSG